MRGHRARAELRCLMRFEEKLTYKPEGYKFDADQNDHIAPYRAWQNWRSTAYANRHSLGSLQYILFTLTAICISVIALYQLTAHAKHGL